MASHKIVPVAVEQEMQTSYLSYAMSVIVSRALPDVRDGLKPVQRRILYAMHDMAYGPEKQHRKSAGVVGEVLKNFHPHGDASVYDALVRMAQDFTLRYPLIDGHGNFGSVDGDSAAAMRYTEVRLARIASEMLVDIDKETVDFVPNYDNQGTEPAVLPARIPQLLVNGSSGIAVGMATNIPPHNLREICAALKLLIAKPNADHDEVIDLVKGPDFPTRGAVLGQEAIRNAYRTGRGSVIMRGKAEIEEEKGHYSIVITEIPFQVTKTRVVESIAEAVTEKRIQGVSRLDDESNRKGMRIVLELARNATPQVVLNQLYKHTPLQSTFGFNMLALVPHKEGKLEPGVAGASTPLEPRVLSLKEMLLHYLAHRVDVVYRRTVFDLRKARERAHVLEGYRIALDNIDEVIRLVRGSETTEAARTGLMQRFALSEIQANAILDMRLQRLVGLERAKIEEEYRALLKLIDELELIRHGGAVFENTALMAVVKREIDEVEKKYGDGRRTLVLPAEEEMVMEDLIPDTEVVVTSTSGGYIKRVSVDTFRSQNRGGRGVAGINMKKEDVVKHLFVATTHQYVLFFTNTGRVYRLKAYEIPDSTRTARGTNLVNLLTLGPGEAVTAIFPIRDFEADQYLVMGTKRGVIKKSKIGDFANVRRNGLVAVNLDEGDELLAVDISDGKSDIIMATRKGMAVHFSETDVRSMGRTARGVRAITLGTGDTVAAMDVVEADRQEVLLVTSQGYGKRTPIDEYRHTSRGGKGVKAFARAEKLGVVVDQILVNEHDELMLITNEGTTIRMFVNMIRKSGRTSQGVILQRLGKHEEVIAIANLERLAKGVRDITGETAE
ncbi:DNA gyrase subunit A [bacterium]|nr:MAG: DNA gyrase subunit A [bacterium]